MEINIENWKEFEVGNLFKAITKTAKVKNFTRENCKDDIHSIPALSSLALNNSHGFYVKKSEHKLIDSPSLSVTSNGVNAGTVFVQTEPFAIVQDAYALIIKDYNPSKEAYLFIATTLEKLLIDRYGFNEKAVWNKVKKEKIPLPAIYNAEKEKYEPNWNYMEEFIKELKEENERKLSSLKTALCPDNAITRGGYILDISDWHEFEINELFKYERGKESAPNQNEDGECRLLSETQDNNGFVRLVKPTKIINGHCLTVSVNYASTVFYQEEDFCASVNLIVLRPKIKTTVNQLLFIATILSKKHESYSYTDKVSKDLLMKDKIKLPTIYTPEDDKYEPDWEYMESFITNIQRDVKNQLRRLRQNE